MDAVEFVRQYNVSMKRRNKLAVAIAAICGFVMGVIMTLLFPLITEWMTSLNFTLSLHNTQSMTFDFGYLGWMIVAGVSVVTALSAYEITLARFSPKMNQIIPDPHHNVSEKI